MLLQVDFEDQTIKNYYMIKRFTAFMYCTVSQINQCSDKSGSIYVCAQKRNGQLPGSHASWNQFAGRGEKGPGPPSPSKMSQLEPSRDGETMRRNKDESILDAMREDQGQTERGELLLLTIDNSEEVTSNTFV